MNIGEEDNVVVKDGEGQEIEGVKYKISEKHRDSSNADASYWILTPDQEFNLFKDNWLSCWSSLPNYDVESKRVNGKNKKVRVYHKGTVYGIEQFYPNDAFALCIQNNAPCVVGRTKADKTVKANNIEDKRSDSIYARFESDKNTNNKKWHGYPAAPNLNDHDIPDSCYLKYWVKQGYISNAVATRLLRKLPKKK